MITKQELLNAIAECQGVRNPNANTCIKLAAFYTILNNMEDDDTSDRTEYKITTLQDTSYLGNSELSELVRMKGIHKVFPILEELMDTLLVLYPKLYQSVIEKIEDV